MKDSWGILSFEIPIIHCEPDELIPCLLGKGRCDKDAAGEQHENIQLRSLTLFDDYSGSLRRACDIQDSMFRLGDDIDDYCSRCKLGTDHSVVSVMNDQVLKTRCRTCNFEHNYRHNKGGKGQMTARQAFDQLLASVTGGHSEPAPKAAKARKKKPGAGASRSTEA